MTNRELNEAIARLKGWEPCLGMVSDWKHPPSQTSMTLPDFLDDDHLRELLELANDVLGEWSLTKWLVPRGYTARRHGDEYSKELDNPSEAIARAIVGYKKTPAPK